MAAFTRLTQALLRLPRGRAEGVIVAASVGGSWLLTGLSLGFLRDAGVTWHIPMTIATIVPLLVATPVAIVLMRLMRDLERARAEAYALANTDMLTGVYNRRRWIELAERELQRAASDRRPVTLLMLDVDNFKQVNDLHGHTVGDAVLRMVADACARTLRPADPLARWGGEEFVMLLAGTTVDEGVAAGERVRAAIAGTAVRTAAGDLNVTVSIGVVGTTAALTGYELHRLVHIADCAMYSAKQDGKNLVARAKFISAEDSAVNRAPFAAAANS
jgi:diguanylate cyclase (GGDEF)-like protein